MLKNSRCHSKVTMTTVLGYCDQLALVLKYQVQKSCKITRVFGIRTFDAVLQIVRLLSTRNNLKLQTQISFVSTNDAICKRFCFCHKQLCCATTYTKRLSMLSRREQQCHTANLDVYRAANVVHRSKNETLSGPTEVRLQCLYFILY